MLFLTIVCGMRMQICSRHDPSHVDDRDDSDSTAHWDKKIVAAIDFGTCNTKMAFAFFNPLSHSGNDRIVVMDAWENAPNALMAPTTILIDHTGEVVAYGYEAEEKFRALPIAQAKISYLFKNFKMALHQKEVCKVFALYTKTSYSYNSFYCSSPVAEIVIKT